MTGDGLERITLEQLRLRESAKWSTYPADVLPAFVAEMDCPLAPPVRRALIGAIQRGDTGYANAPASELGVAFARFAGRRWGWPVDPEQVSATTDVVRGLTALVRSLIDPGDGVILSPPVYHPFFSLIERAGGKAVETPLGPSGELDLEAIEVAFRTGAKVLLLCSPQNPTGRVPSRSELARLAELAAEHDGWVLSDEIHAPLTLPGASHVPFLTVSPEAARHGICLTSASKAFNLAGLGCALVVTASHRARETVESLPPETFHPGHLGVIAARAAFTDGDDWLDRVVERIQLNFELLAELLDEQVPSISWRPPEASYLTWLDCRRLGLGADPAAVILERSGLAASSGPQFGRGGSGYLRLNVGTTPGIVREAVSRIADAV